MREALERVVGQCLTAGLADAGHVVVDGSHAQADASPSRSVDGPEDLPGHGVGRAIRDDLSDLGHTAPDLDGVRRSRPKRLSATGPAAALSRKHGRAVRAYGPNAMRGPGSGIVLDVQAAPERHADEPKAARQRIGRLERRPDARPDVLADDQACDSGPFVAWLEGRGIRAHVRIPDRSAQTGGMMERSAFVYEAGRDRYMYPNSKPLERVELRNGVIRYRARKDDCGRCPLKPGCTGGRFRTLSRSIHEAVRERVRAREGTAAFVRSQGLRWRVEHLFGTIKHSDGLRRLRLRGLRGADEQFLLAATARNLKRMVRLIGQTPLDRQAPVR